MTIEATASGMVTTPVVRSLIAKARQSSSRVIGIRATPDPSSERTFLDGGEQVHVVPCVSSLAVRDALQEHQPDSWLVILTDRSEEDLGPGLMAHFAWQRLRNPDPWDAVKQRFGADSLDRALATVPRRAEIAQGLLHISPDDGWPQAPAGVLTMSHAFGAVASDRLGLSSGPVDVLSVLEWTACDGAAGRIVELRSDAGNELADAVLEWIASEAEQAAAPLRQLLLSGHAAEALPLGIVLQVLLSATQRDTADERQRAQLALARLDHRWAGAPTKVTAESLAAMALSASAVVSGQLADPRRWPAARATLLAADRMLVEIQAEDLGRDSELLPSGLSGRLLRTAEALRAAAGTPDMHAVESAWAAVESHRLALVQHLDAQDSRISPFRATVRLARWLAAPDSNVSGLAALARRQSQTDAWVDAAYNDAAAGVADAALGEGLEAVLRAVETRRTAHDREFAKALALATSQDDGAAKGCLSGDGDRVQLIERLLPDVVVPLATRRPTLLLVLDGMSTGTATELISTLTRGHEGWNEVIGKDFEKRACALAVLPTFTEHSRASLLCGELASGGQDREQAGFAAVTRAGGLARSVLFHKKPLDSSRPGLALADDVAAAIEDSTTPLVACVLNTIDDALDRSDPAGTVWTQDAVKHLRPLLAAALAANRAVVLTADHGHIVERRRGTQRTAAEISSARSRNIQGAVVEDEVLVEGRRVLTPGGKAVLAVDETLRYGPLKAGYHGGASPAEAVVPFAVLVPGVDAPQEWKLAAPQEPTWWSVALASPAAPAPLPDTKLLNGGKGETPSLFGELDAEPQGVAESIGVAITATSTYREQKAIAGRIAVGDADVAALLDALAAAPGTRLAQAAAAVVLQLPQPRMPGAVAQLQKLLNVEGYAVLRIDGTTLVLDLPLLRDQFGVKQ